jgi:signal transduction histidine kinase
MVTPMRQATTTALAPKSRPRRPTHSRFPAGHRRALVSAAVAVLGLVALAWLNYLLISSFFVGWTSLGDAFVVVAYVLLVAGAARELRARLRARARAAVREERSRVARELHDGVAQELAHVLGQARRLAALRPEPDTERLLGAAERALAESRSAISTLRAPLDERLDRALERSAGELGRRLGLDVHVDADTTAPAVAPPVREAVVRIVGEALANAARHGDARAVTIELRGGARSRVTVRDDGCGFDPDPARIPPGAFGLLSMRERAEACGGVLTIRSASEAGTEVEVTLP